MLINKPYQNFLDKLDNKEPQTKEQYIKYFKYYLQFLKVKDPNLLITKRFYSPRELQRIEDKIVSYINHLKNQYKNQSTIKGRKSAIEFFYRANRITLDWKHISGYIPAPTKRREDLAYTTEDIQKMLKATASPERDDFMLYLLSSTGMRIGALPDLKYGDIELMKPEGYPRHLYKIIVYRGTRYEYYTFTTFECAEALDSYIEYRKRMGENITKDSPLLRDQFNSNYRNKKKNEPNFIRSFSDVVDRIANRAGVRTRGHDRQTRHEKALDHGFRKFTITQMIKAGVEYDSREFLTGHKITRGLDTSYSRTPVEDRLNEYMKVLEYLTIDRSQRLRKKLAESEMTINIKLAQKDKQISALERQMRQYRKEVQMVMSNPAAVQKLRGEVSRLESKE